MDTEPGTANEATAPRPSSVGVVDIGSTTATLALYHGGPAGYVDRFDQVGEALHLMRALGGGRTLPGAARDRTVATMKAFARRASDAGVQVVTGVATSAVRDAENGAELLAAIRAASGIPIELLGGEDEARIAARSAMETLPFAEGLVVDLGGGSVQIARVLGRRVRNAISLPMGSARLSEAFLRSDPPSAAEITAARRRVEALLRPIPWLTEARAMVGIGGTIRCLAKIDRRDRRWPLAHGHGYDLTLDAVLAQVDSLSRMRAAERAEVPGVATHRVGTLVGGAIALAAVLRLAGRDDLMVSTYGLREGIAIPLLHGAALVPDVRNAGLLGRFPDPTGRGIRAGRAAGRTFDELAPRAGIERWWRAVVVGAVRIAVSASADPRHLIEEPLIGHRQAEVVGIAGLLGLFSSPVPATLRAIFDEHTRR